MNEITFTKLKYSSRKTRSYFKNIYRDFSNRGKSVSKNPVFILGNQKSGTSAVAALLAKMTNSSVCIDLKKEVWSPTYHKVLKNEIAFEKFIQHHFVDFSKDIVKEPNLTFLYSELSERFPECKFVFVIRDPRSNIKSILNRLSIPGYVEDLSPSHKAALTYSWQLILNNAGLAANKTRPNNHIESLANRWNFCSEIFLEMVKSGARTQTKKDKNEGFCCLIRYEDFLADKEEEIKRLANFLDLKPINDISTSLNVQFQPRGQKNSFWKDEEVNWNAYFGDRNLRIIEETCLYNMREFGYSLDIL